MTGQGGMPRAAGSGASAPQPWVTSPGGAPASVPPTPTGQPPDGQAPGSRPAAPAGTAQSSTATASRPGATGRRPGAATAQRPRTGAPANRPAGGGGRGKRTTARRVKLAVSRVDPWSVMKMSFLLAVAAGIVGFVVTVVLWLILSGMGVFADIDRLVSQIQPATGTSQFRIMDYIGFGRVASLSIVFGVIDVVLLTAVATLSAFLYNICSALVGGLQLTLTDD